MSCLQQKKKFLMMVTATCAALSTALLVMSVASEHWLHSKELFEGDIKKLYFLPKNFTGSIYIYTNFGLWRSCQQYVGESSFRFNST